MTRQPETVTVGNEGGRGGAEFFGLGGLLFVGGQLFVFGLGSGRHDEFVAEVVKLGDRVPHGSSAGEGLEGVPDADEEHSPPDPLEGPVGG